MSLTTPSSLSSNTPTNSCSTGGTSSASLPENISDARKRTSERHIEYLTANATAWTDVKKTREAMSKRKKRPVTQVAQDELNKKVDKFYYSNRYKAAFKEATLEVAKNRDAPQRQGKKGNGIRAIVKQINDEKLPSPNDMKLKRGAVFNAVSRGDIGVSPLKKGKKETVPQLVTHALATQATMMQVCAGAEGEALAPNMIATASALIANTDHKFSANYAWRKTRMRHPEILNPVKAKNH